MMKTVYILFFSVWLWNPQVFSQTAKVPDTLSGEVSVSRDTVKQTTAQGRSVSPSQAGIRKKVSSDSVAEGSQKLQDTTAADKGQTKLPDLAAINVNTPHSNIIAQVLRNNKLINSEGTPQFFVIEMHSSDNTRDVFFYVMCGLLLILGIFKTFYSHYFSTLFTVYFNTSLRQTQLSEQLLQAKLPSFILNIFFVLTGGIFCWLIFMNVQPKTTESAFGALRICLAGVAIVYIIKYCFLKFIGWISGFSDTANHYIFIIFLVNKLLAIVLIPFIILIAFADSQWMNIYITLSLLSIAVILLSRYIKSYGLVRQKIPITPFHFIVFFLGAEFIPLLIIYKVMVDYILV